jgi:fibronectin type 3 domain-containing protein
VYYGTASGSYLQQRGAGINAGSSTAYTVTGLKSGTQYYFAVTAVDNAGNESAFSNEGSKLVQ